MRKNIRHTCDDLSRRIADNYIETVRLKTIAWKYTWNVYLKIYFEKL